MTDETTQGVGTEQPAAPSEDAQIATDAPASEAVNSDKPAEQSTETVVASEPVPAEEPEWIEGAELGDGETRRRFDKKLARKYYMQVDEMGGEPVFNATRDLASDLISAEPDGVRIAQKLYALNPTAYERMGTEVLKATLAREFGADVTFEQIAQGLQALRQPTQAEPNEQANEETEPSYLSPEIEAKLKKLDELERKFPELETKVGKFDELQEARKQEQIQEFGQTIIQEAMSPLEKLYEDAGLKILPGDSPEEIEAKTEIAQTVQRNAYLKVINDPNNKAFVDETPAGIESLNPLIARKHMLKLQARVEKEAARQLQIFTGKRAQARNLQTEPLTKETPRVVPGVSGAQAFAHTTDASPPFDPERATQVFQDIAGRQ